MHPGWRVKCIFFLGLALSSIGFIAPGHAQTPKREHFQNADVLYDWVTNHRGEKLRTFVTQPKLAAGKVPVIFFVGWLSCDSMEYPTPTLATDLESSCAA